MKLATLGYIRQNNQTLMLHRVKKENDMHKDKWNGLGGKLEDNESPEDCIIREIKEESGLEIKNPQMKGILTFPTFDGNDTWYVFVFLITEFSDELIESNEGDLEWIDNDKLFDLPIWEGDKIFMKWLDQPGFNSGKFSYKDGRLFDNQVIHYE